MSGGLELDGIRGTRGVAKFVLPSILMMVSISAYVMVDGAIISNLKGSDALAACNLTMPVFSLFTALGYMLASGGSALVSKKMGEGKREEANSNFTLIVITGIVLAMVITLFCCLVMDDLIYALGADDALFDTTRAYLLPYVFFAPVVLTQVIVNQFFIVAGRAGTAFAVSVGAGLSNIVLDLLFMGVMGMGVEGAAYASGLSSLIPCSVALYVFTSSKRSTLVFRHPIWSIAVIGKTCSNGASEMVSELSGVVSTLAFNLVMMHYVGVDGVAAITILMYVQFLALAIIMGYSVGIAPVMSYQYGKGDKEAMAEIYRISMRFCLLFSIAVFLSMEAFGGFVVSAFEAGNDNLHDIAMRGVRIHSFAYLFMGTNLYASSLFTSLSNGKLSALISALRVLIVLVPLVILLPMVLGVDGVWLAIPITELAVVILSVYLLYSNEQKYGYGRLVHKPRPDGA
ncbi:MAG: MATE family efflux transporter [Thermoplasmata archaeon]|nr:MATE family efflux transporter [Thermoplasmata archaeon]